MTDDERKAWDECVAQVRRHKDKCNYDEPKMESILAADAELKSFRAKLDREKLADAIYRGSKSGKDEPCGYVYRPGLLAMADAIIAYLKEG